MSRRTAITFSTVGTILFLWTATNTVGQVAPNLGDIWPVLLPAALGVVLTLPVWLRGLIAAANLRAWWWYLFLCVFLWALPVAALVSAIAGPMLPSTTLPRGGVDVVEFD
ncbi:MAG TPA: hypothetical protein VFU88_08580 [Ktedonobacterales bacterium]|nr:hypothetical protein [Ktedonobacterales bacterium]